MSVALKRRSQADLDVIEAIDWYSSEADADVALDFIDELESTYALISRNPALGSLNLGIEVGITGLRSFALVKFPFVVFAMDQGKYVEVWRALHSARDLHGLLT